jgi:hypothetical protein
LALGAIELGGARLEPPARALERTHEIAVALHAYHPLDDPFDVGLRTPISGRPFARLVGEPHDALHGNEERSAHRRGDEQPGDDALPEGQVDRVVTARPRPAEAAHSPAALSMK